MRIDHRLLVPQTLNHFSEHPSLRDTLLRTVEDAQACGRRCPHMLLTGLPDSGKRTLARTIVSEFAARAAFVDITIFNETMDLHEVFRLADHRSFVVLNGIELLNAPSLADLCHATARVPLIGRISNVHPVLPFIKPPPKRAPEKWSYRNFTLIATTRCELPMHSQLFEWVERSFYLTRSVEAETIRLRRATLRLGLHLSPDALVLAAETAIRASIRTLHMIALIAEWMRSLLLTEVDAPQLEEFLGTHVSHLMKFSVAAEGRGTQRLQRGTPLPSNLLCAPQPQDGAAQA